MAPRGGSDTADRIRQEAIELFRQRGFEGTSMRDLAHAVDVSTAALYYHYENKDALLVAVVEPVLAAIDELLASERPLREFLEGYVDLVLANEAVVDLTEQDLGIRNHPLVRDALEQRLIAIRERVAAGRRDVEALLRASAALGAIRRPLRTLDPAPDTARSLLVDAALAVLGGR